MVGYKGWYGYSLPCSPQDIILLWLIMPSCYYSVGSKYVCNVSHVYMYSMCTLHTITLLLQLSAYM